MCELARLCKTLPHLYGEPTLSGVIRQSVEDFIVEEDLGFEPDGEGHHVLLFIEKRDTNTQWVVKQLARYAGLPKMEIGYAGLKDRHAITRQWFSVHLAGREIDWQGFNSDQWQILKATRHQRKLRPGFLRGNKFQIRVRDLSGELDGLEDKLNAIREGGIANYYGEQRFGFDNLQRAYAWLAGEIKIKKKQEKSLLLSSLRSAIFNQIVAERIRQACWDQALIGDVMMLAGSHSVFSATELDAELRSRLASRDVVTTAPLYGKGESLAQSDGLQFETGILKQFPELCERLEQAGLSAQRRAVIAMPEEMQWRLDLNNRILEVEFSLTSGAYATSLLRELVNYETSKA